VEFDFYLLSLSRNNCLNRMKGENGFVKIKNIFSPAIKISDAGCE
jgi:hypothetical protein